MGSIPITRSIHHQHLAIKCRPGAGYQLFLLTTTTENIAFKPVASALLMGVFSLAAAVARAQPAAPGDDPHSGRANPAVARPFIAHTPDEPGRFPAGTGNLIAVFGTSLGKGQGSSGYAHGVTASQIYISGNSWSNGWAADLTTHLRAGGWVVTNDSLPGDNSTNGLKRFFTTVVPQAPKFVLISYSLGNDNLGYSQNPAGVAAGFLGNLKQMTEAARAAGIYPIVGLCYARDDIQKAGRYDYLKTVNLAINTWGLPSLNFDGAINNGQGGLAAGTGYGDGVHPNDYGYREFYYAIPPTLFDALAQGKTNRPHLAAAHRYARLTRSAGVFAPVTFTPESPFHSFTMSFRVRSSGNGTIAAVRAGRHYSTLQITNGQLVYFVPDGSRIAAAGINATNGQWHAVAISFRYALTNTWLFVDGVQAGCLRGQVPPDQFILGGPGWPEGPPPPAVADFQNWCVYRSAWNLGEAQAQAHGNLQQASLEIGAMLDDPAFAARTPASNRAQSLAVAMVNSPKLVASQEASPPQKSESATDRAGNQD